MPLPHYIKTFVTLLVSTFRALVYKLLVEFEQQLIFKVSRVNSNPAQLKSRSQAAEAGMTSIEFQLVREISALKYCDTKTNNITLYHDSLDDLKWSFIITLAFKYHGKLLR